MRIGLRCGLLCLVLLMAAGAAAGRENGTDLARGTLIAANDQLVDPRFKGSVVLLLNHDIQGTAGLVVNRASRLSLKQVLSRGSKLSGPEKYLYYGGPVDPENLLALVLVRGNPPEPAEQIFDGLYLTGLNILDDWHGYAAEAVDFMAFAGYAGWAHHQLENEMNRGDWRVLRAEGGTDAPDAGSKLWKRLQGFQEVRGTATQPSQ